MRTMCSREIVTKKCRQQQNFDSDLKGAWHYNHVTFTPIAKTFMLYCRSIYMLSILCVRLTIKVKVGIPESFKVGWYPPKKTGSSHLNWNSFIACCSALIAEHFRRNFAINSATKKSPRNEIFCQLLSFGSCKWSLPQFESNAGEVPQTGNQSKAV